MLSQPIEAGQVGDAHKTGNLQAKGRMTAHLYGEVSALRVDNVEMVMVDEPPVFGPSQHYFTSGIVFGLPDQGRSFGNENGKHPSELGIGRTKFFGLGVLGFVAEIGRASCRERV